MARFRVLVFNSIVPLDALGDETWSNQQVSILGDSLRSPSAAGILDHDIFVLGVSKTAHLVPPGPTIHEQIMGRVEGGGLLVCFCEAALFGWLKPQALVKEQSGGVISRDRALTAYESLGDALQREPQFEVQFLKVSQGQDLAWAGDGKAVAVTAPHGKGRLLLLPPMRKTRAQVLRSILDKIVPVVMPHLEPAPSAQALSEPEPDWLINYEVPGMSTYRALAAELSDKRDELERARQATQAALEGLSRMRGLLALTGTALEDCVRDALTRMGMRCVKEDPIDAVYRCQNGTRLFIEIEGSKTSIGVRKGRQLLDYITRASDSEPMPYGAIIGNPSMQEDPALRFQNSQGQPFAKELVDLAGRFNPPWKLLTTHELFKLYCRHQAGDGEAIGELKARLLPPGAA